MIGEMVARVREMDPQFFDRFGDGPLEQDEMPEWSKHHAADAADGEAHAREFDARLGGRVSLLDGLFAACAARPRRVPIARSLGLTEGGVLRMTEALDRLLNPARNPVSPGNAERRRARAAHAARCSTPISRSPRRSATPPTARTSATAWCPARGRC